MSYFFYIAQCADDSLYSGSCKDLIEREKAHNSGKGAKYTRSRLPVTFVYTETFATKSEALKREAHVKKLSRQQKMQLLSKK